MKIDRLIGILAVLLQQDMVTAPELESGDIVHTQIVCDGGSVSIEVKCGDNKPVYKGDAVSESYEFDIMIEESGTYTITVTGEKAKGSVSFTVEKNAN